MGLMTDLGLSRILTADPPDNRMSGTPLEMPPPVAPKQQPVKLRPFNEKTSNVEPFNSLRGEAAEAWDNRMSAMLQVARQCGLDSFIEEIDLVRTVGVEKGREHFRKKFHSAFPEVDFSKPGVSIGSSNNSGKFVLTVKANAKTFTSADSEVVRAESIDDFLESAQRTGNADGAPKGFSDSALDSLRLRLQWLKDAR